MNLTYRQLKSFINDLSEEMLDTDVTIHTTGGELFSSRNWSWSANLGLDDVLENQPVIMVDIP